MKINSKSKTIKIDGYVGTWHVIGNRTYPVMVNGRYEFTELFLLEHETYGDETESLIVNNAGRILMSDVWNGFGDVDELDEITYE